MNKTIVISGTVLPDGTIDEKTGGNSPNAETGIVNINPSNELGKVLTGLDGQKINVHITVSII